MPALAGLLSDLKFSFDGGTTWNICDNLVDFDISEPTELIENTGHTTRQRTYMSGHTDPSGSASFITNNTSVVQAGLKAANKNSTSFHIQWFDIQQVGAEIREAAVLLETHDTKRPREGEQTLDISWKFAGAIVDGVQP